MRYLLATIAASALLAATPAAFAGQGQAADEANAKAVQAQGREQVQRYDGEVYRGKLGDRAVYVVVFDRDVGLVPTEPAATSEATSAGPAENEYALTDQAAEAAASEQAAGGMTPTNAAPALEPKAFASELESNGITDVSHIPGGRFFATTASGHTILVISADGKL